MCQEKPPAKKKEKLSPVQQAERFYKRGQAFYERTELEFRQTRENHFASMKAVKEQLNDRLRQQKQELIEMKKIFESVEETLLNVLLAIRQNEYLQANYPAQHGFPELKVTGTHPAN
jgi:response regulator RpfG family c-di-GMP phosphodiesterase